MLDIFNSATPQNGKFFKFKEIGDSIQGTYINKREGIDGYGNPQIIYVIKDSVGEVWNIAYRKTNEVIQKQMDEVHLGQIVGFRLDAKKDNKKVPGTTMNIINQYSDPKFVDHAWLEERKKIVETFGSASPDNGGQVSGGGEESNEVVEKEWSAVGGNNNVAKSVFTREKAPDESQPLKASIPVSSDTGTFTKADDTLIAIRKLATTKGLIKAGMDTETADSLIEAFTQMKLNKGNYTKIIVALSGYVEA